MEAGYRCANPRCNVVVTTELHHVDRVADGGGDEASNLLVLCPNCHAQHHSGVIPKDAIRAWKNMLVALNHSFDRRARDLLLLLRDAENEEADWPRTYTSDGVVAFAPLLATGLAEARMTSAASDFGGSPPWEAFRVLLTDRGRALLQAWETGDDAAYRSFLDRGGFP